MPKSLQGGTISQIDASKRRPVILVELGLNTTQRYAISNQDIVFPESGNTYTAKAITFGSIEQSSEGKIQQISVNFDNTAKDMAAYVNAENFQGKTLTVKRIFLDDIDSANDYVELFYGEMYTPTDISRNWVTIKALAGKQLSKRTIPAKYQKLCHHNFGDAACNRDGYANLTSLTAAGTADSGDTTYLIDNALTQAEGYWKYGDVVVVKSGVYYYRRISDFTAATDKVTFDVPLPVAVDNTCTYVVRKGCDQLWNTCQANSAWGPGTDNKNNFGGFVHIPVTENTEGKYTTIDVTTGGEIDTTVGAGEPGPSWVQQIFGNLFGKWLR